MEKVTFTLYGRIPSKKNSKIIRVINGRPLTFSSVNYTAWQKEQLKYLGGTKIAPIKVISCIELAFYAPDSRKTDLTNKAESVMDLLVDAGVMSDDNWQIVPMLLLVYMGVDRETPRCVVNIT